MQVFHINANGARRVMARPVLVGVLIVALSGAVCGLLREHWRQAEAREAVTFLPQLQVIMGRLYIDAGRYGSGGRCAEAMPVSPDLNFEYSCVTDEDGSTYRIRAVGKADALTSGIEYVIDNAGLRSARCETCDWRVADAMLYVGANDGMLHGFKAADGTETLAYIPSSLIPHLSKLTDRAYTHRYYVDGTPIIRDVKVGGAWKTLLVGTLGAGGKAVFALDVTDPTNFSQDATKAKDIVAWEFDERIDADLGYTFGRPSIVQMANGRWAAVLGNGYNSTATGKAFLFILFLDRTPGRKTWVKGVDYLKLPTSTAASLVDGTPGSPNGLSQPLAADVDGDGVIDYVYAGDLLGNLWKFNVKGDDSSTWGLAWGLNRPLFSAKSANNASQPITAAPDVLRHPNGGYVVVFGTGRYLQTADVTDPSTQTLYGIRDEDGAQAPSPGIDRSQLTQQSILAEREVAIELASTSSTTPTVPSATTTTTNAGREVKKVGYRLTTNNTAAPSSKGWYMDLKLSGAATNSGERVVYAPAVRNGRVIFTTTIPSRLTCEDGTSWLMELDALTGSRLLDSPFDVNGDGEFTVADQLTLFSPGASGGAEQRAVVSGLRSAIGIASAPTILETGKPREIKVMSGSTGDVQSVLENAPGAGRRLSWREILQ